MSLRCETCVNYRPSRRGLLVQNLSRELKTKSEEVFSKADRQRQKEDEAQSADSAVARQMGLWAEVWESRPLMEHYCGVDEHLDRFYVVQIKEPTCRQYEPTSSQRACATCAFRRESTGQLSDLQKLSNTVRYEAASRSFYRGMLSGSSDRERQAGKDRRGYAIEEALNSATVQSADVQYFSTCKRMDYEHQGTGERVLCAWANPTDTCGYWSGASPFQWIQPVSATAASFRLAGFRFEQKSDGSATMLKIYATQFAGFAPRCLEFRLDWVLLDETRSFAGIVAARITVQRLSNAWKYWVYPLGQVEKSDVLIAPSGGYAE